MDALGSDIVFLLLLSKNKNRNRKHAGPLLYFPLYYYDKLLTHSLLNFVSTHSNTKTSVLEQNCI